MSKMEDALEAFVTEIAEAAVETGIDNHDFSDEIEKEVENAFENYDVSSAVESALDDYDFGDVINQLKHDIQEEVTDELKDTIYEAMLKKLE